MWRQQWLVVVYIQPVCTLSCKDHFSSVASVFLHESKGYEWITTSGIENPITFNVQDEIFMLTSAKQERKVKTEQQHQLSANDCEGNFGMGVGREQTNCVRQPFLSLSAVTQRDRWINTSNAVSEKHQDLTAPGDSTWGFYPVERLLSISMGPQYHYIKSAMF